MSGIYSTNKIKNLNQLNDVNITDISNNDIIQYNSTNGLWENKSDFTTGDITCDNLDILEKLSIQGDYGSSGSILTSQGSGASPTWNEPYRMRVYKTSNQPIQDQTTTIVTGFTKDTEVSTTQGATDYNTTLSRWTPSISGIYNISVTIFVSPPSGTGTGAGNILRIKAKLMSSSGSGTLLRVGEYMSDYSDDGVYFMGVSISDIVSIDSSLYYYLEVYFDRVSGNAQVVGGTALTWFSAYKI